MYIQTRAHTHKHEKQKGTIKVLTGFSRKIIKRQKYIQMFTCMYVAILEFTQCMCLNTYNARNQIIYESSHCVLI